MRALPSQELAFGRKISYTNRTRVSAQFSSMVLDWEWIMAIVCWPCLDVMRIQKLIL